MTVAESAKASYEYILDSVMGKLADKGGGRGFRKARDEGEWKRSISAMVEMDIADAKVTDCEGANCESVKIVKA